MPSIGNSDHDIVLFDTTITATRPIPPRRKILLWKKADIQCLRDDLSDLSRITNLIDPSIEDSWARITSKKHTTMITSRNKPCLWRKKKKKKKKKKKVINII